jgi:oligopeptide transport system substrate-binding protein
MMVIAAVVTVGVSAWTIWGNVSEMQAFQSEAFDFGTAQADKVAKAVNDELASQMVVVDGIVANLNDGSLQYKDIAARLREEVKNKPNMYGLGAAFEPYAYKKDIELFGPYYYKDPTGEFKRADVDTQYDYTNEANSALTDWYVGTVKAGKPRWVIYVDEVTGNKLVEYAAPFVDPADPTKVVGVIYVDHSLDTLRAFLRTVDVGEEGYSFILANSGEVVIHPDRTLQGRMIDLVAEELDNPQMVADFDRAKAGESFPLTIAEGRQSDNVWTFYRPLVAEGWSVATAINKSANDPAPEKIIRDRMNIGLIVMLALFVVSAWLARLDKLEPANLWKFTLLVAVLLLVQVAWIWSLVHNYPLKAADQEVLTSQGIVDTALDTKVSPYLSGEPVKIPTGIIIKSLNVGTSDATISGYIWQKFPEGINPDDVGGVRFPEALGDPTMSEVYRFQQGNEMVVGWFFVVTLGQHFDLTRYPLDQASVTIPFWPQNLNGSVVFVPDFDAYDFLAPSAKPGLDEKLDLLGWSIYRSFFSYRYDKYNADFGDAAKIQRNVLPTLVFNIEANRNLLSPLIAYCITAFVVAAMLFGILMVNIETPYNALSNASALFFVVAITHVGLRGALNASGVVYLEYLFILQYVFVLGSAVNGMLYYSGSKFPVIHYMENLPVRIMYWPALLIMFLAITFAIFYPAATATASTAPAPVIVAPVATESVVEATPTPKPTQSFSTNNPATATGPLLPPQAIAFDDQTVTLRIPIYLLPTIDPSLTNQLSSTEQNNNLFIGLTRLVPSTGEIIPALAESWTTSEDGLTWVFILRQDIPWVQYKPSADGSGGMVNHVTDFDGNPRYVNAYDVVYGIQRTLTSDNTSAGLLHVIRNAKPLNTGLDEKGNAVTLSADDLGVKALDAWTVEITLESPAPYFHELLAYDISFPVPSWAIEDLAEDWTQVGNINTSGPYMLGAYSNDRMTLIKNPYWIDAATVQIERIEEPVVTDADKLLAMYVNDQIDTIARPSPEMLAALRSNATVVPELVPYTTLSVQYIVFTNTKFPFDDARIRKAFSMSIDQNFITENVLKDGSAPANVFAPPGVFGAVTDPNVGLHYDPVEAKRLLQSFLDERGLTIDDFNSAYPIKFGQIPSGDKVNEAIVANWKKVLGVEVELVTVPELAPYDHKDVPLDKAFHMVQGNWGADYPDQDNFVRFLFNSQSGSNNPRRNCADEVCSAVKNLNDEFDRVTLAALQTTDPAERLKLYAEAELILIEQEAAVAPIFWGASIDVTKPWLTRYYPKLGGFDFYNWIIDTEAQVR